MSTSDSKSEFLNVADVNKKKEEFLNEKLERVEVGLKNLELSYLREFPELKRGKLKHLFKKRYYNELEKIDNLFIKADYLGLKSSNLIMDEIDERINKLIAILKKENSTINMEVM